MNPHEIVGIGALRKRVDIGAFLIRRIEQRRRIFANLRHDEITKVREQITRELPEIEPLLGE